MTLAAVLLILAHLAPSQYAADPERMSVIAEATIAATNELAHEWRHAPDELSRAILTAIRFESGLREDVHSGALLGKAGERCLMQIHPGNRVWKTVGAPSFESLTGTDYESTRWCLLAGAKALVLADNYCAARQFRTNWKQAMWTAYHYGSKCWLSPQAFRRARTMGEIAGGR